MSKIIYPYRFKTEQEFISEFGVDWRRVVKCNFTSDMDFLLGKPYPYMKFNTDTYLPCVGSWRISIDMIKYAHPEYKAKTIIYE